MLYMSNFKQYLTESTREYQYKIKVAGDISDDFGARMETALKKYDVKSLSKGKKKPIQETPLDFPGLKNTSVTIFDAVTNYPASTFEMRSYVADYMNVPVNQIVVRKPGEPTEDYQEEMRAKPTSEFKAKLQDVEYKDAPKVKADEVYGDKANQSLLKELLKAKQEKYEIEKGSDNKTQDIQPKEEKGSASPVQAAHKGPVKGNPHPAKGK